MDSIIAVASWWLGLSFIGWVAFVLLKPYLAKLPDGGYAIAKSIGLVVFTYILWLLASLHLVPFGRTSVIDLAVILTVAAGVVAWRRSIPKGEYLNKLILFEELLFMACLAGWGYVRSFNPRAEGVEKLMDVAILNGLLRSDWLPPKDVWYAGESLNYYYFGHLMVATLSKLTGVGAEYASNLGLVGVFALVVTITFSLVVAMTGSKVAGIVAAFLLALSANLDPAINLIKSTKDYIFFAATRLDPYTINEFPLYSFVVADMHAHMLGLAIVMGILGLLYALFVSGPKPSWVLIALLMIVLGATGPTNSFDLAIYGLLTGAVFLTHRLYHQGFSQNEFIRAFVMVLGIGAGAFVLYLPYYLNFHAPVGGIGLALFQTPLTFILINFGILLFIAAPLFWLIPKAWRKLVKQEDLEVSLPYLFGALLLVVAIAAILIPEVVYLRDIYSFQNPPYARANTIFKVYYQAWVMLAIAAGVGLVYMRRLTSETKGPDWLGNGYILTAGALVGLSLIGVWSGFKTMEGKQASNLNGYQYLANEAPGQLALIEWINTNVPGQPTVLEAAGESYTQRSRVSAYTGLATPIGWASHEWGWRYSPEQWPVISARMGDVERMYTTTDAEELKSLVEKWELDYIVVSPVEQEHYSMMSDQLIAQTYGQPVFQSGEYALYKTR